MRAFPREEVISRVTNRPRQERGGEGDSPGRMNFQFIFFNPTARSSSYVCVCRTITAQRRPIQTPMPPLPTKSPAPDPLVLLGVLIYHLRLMTHCRGACVGMGASSRVLPLVEHDRPNGMSNAGHGPPTIRNRSRNHLLRTKFSPHNRPTMRAKENDRSEL